MMKMQASRQLRILATVLTCLCMVLCLCPMASADPAPLGYATVNGYADTETLPYIYDQPKEGANVLELMAHGDMLRVHEDLGEWVHVSLIFEEGYMLKENLLLFLAEDLFITDPITLSDGSYLVGQDLPSGMYVFEINEGQEGRIEVLDEAKDYLREYSATGTTWYSLYLPAEATLTLENGSLTPMDTSGEFNDYAARNAVHGRFFIGLTVSGGYECLRVAAGLEEGAYRVLPITADMGLEEVPEWIQVLPSSPVEIWVEHGNFVEYVGVVDPGNG